MPFNINLIYCNMESYEYKLVRVKIDNNYTILKKNTNSPESESIYTLKLDDSKKQIRLNTIMCRISNCQIIEMTVRLGTNMEMYFNFNIEKNFGYFRSVNCSKNLLLHFPSLNNIG
eukprot:NODE_272_length_11042_cov_1.328338.p4 type:complete len:116 gc:universal NODE_272_length_11042_cov_1.328338:8547-8200(-)